MLIIFTLTILLVVVAAILQSGNESKKLAALKLKYDKCLKGKNKRAALEAGRAYYSALRKGKTLTIYDEQAITNDLSTMGVDTSSPVL